MPLYYLLAHGTQTRYHSDGRTFEWTGGHPAERHVISAYRQRHGVEPKFGDRVPA